MSLRREQAAGSLRFLCRVRLFQAASRSAEFLLTLASECDRECSVALPYSKALIAGQSGIKPEIWSWTFDRLGELACRQMPHWHISKT